MLYRHNAAIGTDWNLFFFGIIYCTLKALCTNVFFILENQIILFNSPFRLKKHIKKLFFWWWHHYGLGTGGMGGGPNP